MTPQHIFDVWAPPGGPWSPWVKPVLFAHIDEESQLITGPLPEIGDTTWLATPDGGTALVIDVAGAGSAVIGMACAHKGYRPVPLYNAVASPTGAPSRGAAVCNLNPIIEALCAITTDVDSLDLADSAPPAFLLDAKRRFGDGATPQPGMFDNRSVSLPTDFPSASTLLSAGIRRVLLVQENQFEPQEDLAHTLLRWQQAGIEIQAIAISLPETAAAPTSITVKRPRLFRQLWQRMLVTAGFRRNPLGGFGGFLPIPSAG